MNKQTKDKVLRSLARLLSENKSRIVNENSLDIAQCPTDDEVIFDRLKVDEAKIDKMIDSVKSVIAAADPVGKTISSHVRNDGLRIENRSVPFGTILIIYEARPDVSIEAAIIALKAGNKILLKGGKEARKYKSLFWQNFGRKRSKKTALTNNFVKYLDISREETQKLIEGKAEKFDLIIPRGGETLIDFVLKNSKGSGHCQRTRK